jgi:hypothetical protein
MSILCPKCFGTCDCASPLNPPRLKSRSIYIIHGRYAPEPYIAGVYCTIEEAAAALSTLSNPDHYEIDQHTLKLT